MYDNGMALVAYYYAKKVASERDGQKKGRNKEFQTVINVFLSDKKSRNDTAVLIGEYLVQEEGNVISSKNLEEYLSEFNTASIELSTDIIEGFITEYSNTTADAETVETFLFENQENDIPKISSLDVDETLDEGVYHVDFGEQKLTMYVRGEDAILFDLKLAEDRDQFKMSLLPKADMVPALATLIPDFEKKAKAATKEGEYWELIADTLNSFIKSDILTVKQDNSYLALSRKRHVDKDVAIDNIIETAPSFWKELIISFEKSDRPNKALISAFSEKMGAVIKSGDIPENPYVSIKNGNKRLVGVDEYIKELDETNLDLASKLTKGGADTNKITIRSVLDTKEIKDPGPKLLKLLAAKYNDKIKYRAVIRMEEREDKSPTHQEPYRKTL